MYSQQMVNEYDQSTGIDNATPYAAHGLCWRTSQQRTRSRKRITSLCFFF